MGVRRPAAPVLVVAVAVVFSLAVRPTPAAAQLSFAMTANAGSAASGSTGVVAGVGSKSAGGLRALPVGIGVGVAIPFVDGEPTASSALHDGPIGDPVRSSPEVEAILAEAREAARRRAARDAAAVVAEQTVRTAGRYVGTRYRWSGASPAAGFDCSGFVRYVYARQGIDLPRMARQQARAGRALPRSLADLAPGDLLFFAQRGTTVDHVAIYAGDGRIVHASSSGRGVRYDELSGARGRWYAQHLVAVRRIIEMEDFLAGGPAADADLPAIPQEQALDASSEERGDGDAPPPED